MNILIDTHIAIWLFINRKKLKEDFIKIVEDLNTKVYVSLITVLEVAVKNLKHGYKEMPLDEKHFLKLCKQSEFDLLPIKASHILNIRNLKVNDDNIVHKDPFDKLLISQSECENLILCTRDTLLLNYDVRNIKIV